MRRWIYNLGIDMTATGDLLSLWINVVIILIGCFETETMTIFILSNPHNYYYYNVFSVS